MNNLIVTNDMSFDFKFKKLLLDALIAVKKVLHITLSCEVSLIIVNNKKIQKLNYKYRGFDKITDVLSFSTYDPKIANMINFILMGDIFISYEKIASQAAEYRHSLKREWVYIFTHALVHLLGYDHSTKKEEKEMNAIVEKVMEQLNIRRK